MNDKLHSIIIILCIGTCLFISIVFFQAANQNPSLFHRVGCFSFVAFSFITALTLSNEKQSIEDSIGLLYCNIMGFCMVFGLEITTKDNLWEGTFCFLFGLMFFMTWYVTIVKFWTERALTQSLNSESAVL